ncbi:MAG: universal stress protein [Gammaproteobacteria bacterium]|jgi:nucleotide-binding universal stress UspA family protein|nr:universal stress protein [Gammaproteobacteria bacterium]
MTKPIDRIMVPLDYSEPAFHAAWIALAIARSMRASLTLFHIHLQEKATRETVVIEYEKLSALTDESYPSLLEDVVVDPSVDSLKARAFSEVEFETASHSLSNEICDYAREHEIGLIVIGAKIHSALHDLLLGNLTAKVVDKAPCPVTVVH